MPTYFCRIAFALLLAALLGLRAHAVNGSGDSPTGTLDTVRPTLLNIVVTSGTSIQATFSEPMRATVLTTPGNYVLSGAGAGTLGANPDLVSGSGPITVDWLQGEMLDGVTLSLRVTGVQDVVGNPISLSSNTASAPGIGVPPFFGGLIATPALATVDDLVTLEFSSSEPLNGDAEVRVNGNLATRTAKSQFTYVYTVLPTDLNGPADVDITGFDLAGNLGTLHVSDTLTIFIPEPEVPLRAWPTILALLAAGVLVLALRRKAITLLLLSLFLAPMAIAANPEVTNVTFVQQPTATGTEVLINYDLTAPNGPCTIRVKLSKNGGGDGFPFPVSAVSGDITDVTTGTGKQIVWRIASDYPNTSIPNARLRVTAYDGFTQWHSIDTIEPRGEISVSELLRVIQIYNLGGFHCDAGTEDGYAPGPGDHSCPPSDIDFAPQNWIISLSELLRAIQFYNMGGYSTSCGSEDDFSAGVGPIFDCSASEGEAEGEGEVQPIEMVAVAAGSFDMGRTASGDDATFGDPNELPVHTVTLSAYQIGKYEVTNQQFCDVLNYAISPVRSYLRTSGDAFWVGTGDIYAFDSHQELLRFSHADCNIQFSANVFSPKSRMGLPGATNYSMRNHPVQNVTWYGAVMFCNWLSEMQGLTPVYDPLTTGWTANFANNGYHLPTEAQWERAAAWNGTKHWTYGVVADTLAGKDRANYFYVGLGYLNPLGLTSFPTTSPVGWFNGINVSPNGGVTTVNSVSPLGCYDMSGNVAEWCHDWYQAFYYTTDPATDPAGATSGSRRAYRGGSVGANHNDCRTAYRNALSPNARGSALGFRLAR